MNGARIRRLVDAGMTVCLFFLMGFPFFGMEAHMAAGVGLFLLLFVHHWLNRRWAPSLRRGRWNAVRRLTAGANLTLFLVMAALLWSSLILARPTVPFLPRLGSMMLGREMHMAATYWGFLVMGFHIGLHGDMFASMTRKLSAGKKKILSAAAPLFALYGAYAFWSRGWTGSLFLQSEYVFFDFKEAKLLYYVDHAAILALCIWLGWQAMLGARQLQRRK